MSVSCFRRVFVGLAIYAGLISCTSNVPSNEQRWVFCMPDGWMFTVNEAEQRVRWGDVEFAYGPSCVGRCLEGFDAVVDALKMKREGKPNFGTWQIYVDGTVGTQGSYTFSIQPDTPNDLVVSSKVYKSASQLFGCEFGGRF